MISPAVVVVVVPGVAVVVPGVVVTTAVESAPGVRTSHVVPSSPPPPPVVGVFSLGPPAMGSTWV